MSCLIISLSLLYILLEGLRDAFMYHIATIMPFRKNLPFNEHYLFSAQRGVVFVVIAFIDWKIAVLSLFSFPFIHNGTYYQVRNWLNPLIYKKGFFDMTTSSTAKFNFNPILRSVLFLAGILIYLFLSSDMLIKII